MQRRAVKIGVAVCVLAGAVGGWSRAQQEDDGSGGQVIIAGGDGAGAGPAVVQPQGGAPGAGGPQMGAPRRFTFSSGDPAQLRQMMMQQVKQRLGIDDQAWQVIGPRLQKVMDLNRQVSAGRGLLGLFGGGLGGPGSGSVVIRGAGPGASAALENAMAQARAAAANPRVVREAGPQGEPTALDKAVAQLRSLADNPSATPEEIKRQMAAVREAREKAQQELAAAQADLVKILTVRQEAQLLLMGQLN